MNAKNKNEYRQKEFEVQTRFVGYKTKVSAFISKKNYKNRSISEENVNN